MKVFYLSSEGRHIYALHTPFFFISKDISNVESYIQNLAHSRCSVRVDVRVRASAHMRVYACARQGSGGAVEGTRGRLRHALPYQRWRKTRQLRTWRDTRKMDTIVTHAMAMPSYLGGLGFGVWGAGFRI